MKVLFITGFGRSGTTLVDQILGQVDGFHSLGEAQYVWDRGLEKNLLCSCGDPFRECPLWGPLAPELAADLDDGDLRGLARLRDRQGPIRTLARSALRGALPDRAAWERYRERTGLLYRAVRRATGSRVLVDSSKSPSHGLVLAGLPDVELYVLHMVRDPRAVVHSWGKTMVYDGSGGEPMYMARLSLRHASVSWLGWNAAIELLWRRRRERHLLLRYEDFVARPQQSLEAVLALLGEEGAALPFAGERTVELETIHSVAGNPNRFATGRVEIRSDEGWKGAMAASRQLAVASLTWPLLPRYGYLRPLVATGG
ncbi:MAG: sulfotransferase [Thermoanaerobaculia bacterium]